MNIKTEGDCLGEIEEREGFLSFSYADGSLARLPHGFIRIANEDAGDFYIGKFSAFGIGSSVRFDLPNQKVFVGRYVSGGENIKFMLIGFHEARTISTCEFGSYDKTLQHVKQREHPEIIIMNDVWIGDECLIMGGSKIESGCIIGARSILPCDFKTEPFGVYAGVPAKLKKFRFSEKVRELLLDIAWWDMPIAWIKENNKYFMMDMTTDSVVNILYELKERKEKWMSDQSISAA
jgi:acetyltransferase-like isoleucine patch superfamily enzyme